MVRTANNTAYFIVLINYDYLLLLLHPCVYLCTGGKLELHADFNYYAGYKLYRRVNTFVYLNDDWREEFGGHLELWDKNLSTCGQNILPAFNRFVAFSTTDFTYHGQPVPLTAGGRSRRSIALYYYTAARPLEECINKECDIYHSTMWKFPTDTCKRLLNNSTGTGIGTGTAAVAAAGRESIWRRKTGTKDAARGRQTN